MSSVRNIKKTLPTRFSHRNQGTGSRNEVRERLRMKLVARESGNELKTKHYEEANRELKRRYEIFTGVNPNDTSFSTFTKEEQIERYAKNLAFWYMENCDARVGLRKAPSNPKWVAKAFLTAKGERSIRNRIDEKFTSTIREKIYAQKTEDRRIMSCS